MLLPVEMRISELMYPKSIEIRIKTLARSKTVFRKNKWAAKLGGHYLGTTGRKWAKKIQSQAKVDGRPAQGPKANG